MTRSKIDHRANDDRLIQRRRRAAEHRWRCYDFGHEVRNQGDWQQNGRDGRHWRRLVSLRIGDAEVEASFAVTFAAKTKHMIEAYAEIGSDPAVQVDNGPTTSAVWPEALKATSVSRVMLQAEVRSSRSARWHARNRVQAVPTIFSEEQPRF